MTCRPLRFDLAEVVFEQTGVFRGSLLEAFQLPETPALESAAAHAEQRQREGGEVVFVGPLHRFAVKRAKIDDRPLVRRFARKTNVDRRVVAEGIGRDAMRGEIRQVAGKHLALLRGVLEMMETVDL